MFEDGYAEAYWYYWNEEEDGYNILEKFFEVNGTLSRLVILEPSSLKCMSCHFYFCLFVMGLCQR